MDWLSGKRFDPNSDIEDLSAKTILITGGNNGLGAASVRAFAKHNARIYLAARSPSKAEATIADIKHAIPNANITYLRLDLASFDSVKEAAEAFKSTSNELHVLMNNAGIAGHPPSQTEEGYEIHFGTNHMGHALLTKLLLPILEGTAERPGSEVRIINLSSEGHILAPKNGLVLNDDCTSMEQYSTWTRYGQSKLANILYTKELARRYPKIKSITLHPGSVDTGLTLSFQAQHSWWAPPIYRVLNMFVLKTPERGALTQLWAATSGAARSGIYYIPVAKESKGSSHSRDENLAHELWDWTEKELLKHVL